MSPVFSLPASLPSSSSSPRNQFSLVPAVSVKPTDQQRYPSGLKTLCVHTLPEYASHPHQTIQCHHVYACSSFVTEFGIQTLSSSASSWLICSFQCFLAMQFSSSDVLVTKDGITVFFGILVSTLKIMKKKLSHTHWYTNGTDQCEQAVPGHCSFVLVHSETTLQMAVSWLLLCASSVNHKHQTKTEHIASSLDIGHIYQLLCLPASGLHNCQLHCFPLGLGWLVILTGTQICYTRTWQKLLGYIMAHSTTPVSHSKALWLTYCRSGYICFIEIFLGMMGSMEQAQRIHSPPVWGKDQELLHNHKPCFISADSWTWTIDRDRWGVRMICVTFGDVSRGVLTIVASAIERNARSSFTV